MDAHAARRLAPARTVLHLLCNIASQQAGRPALMSGIEWNSNQDEDFSGGGYRVREDERTL